MKFRGVLKKMPTDFSEPVKYYLEMEQDIIQLNQFIGRKLSFQFLSYQCLNCGLDKKIFRQGFCYDCFNSSAHVGEWIIRPELSKAHLGIEDRDLEYEKSVQLKPHIVYLALSSNVKVGVTRKTQVPTRWIDQGASKALAILEVPNRYLAGIAEVSLKDLLSDKTDWRKMLKNEIGEADLYEVFKEIENKLPEEVKSYIVADPDQIWTFDYPVTHFPSKLNSQNFNKSETIEGLFNGIKGQYLYLDEAKVFNIRNSEGHVVELEII